MTGISVLLNKWGIIIIALMIMALLLVIAYSQGGNLLGIKLPTW